MALRVDPAQLTRRRTSCAPGGRWAARRTPSTGTPTPWCWNIPPPCSCCPVSSPARCPCRTAARSWPRRCWTRGPACACSMPARRPAARHCTSRNARPTLGELVAVDRRPAAPAARAGQSRARGSPGAADHRGPDARRLPSLAAASFDRVLVDAPCSASGVIRRHPDIKLLRRPADIDGLRRHPAQDSAHRFRTTSARRASDLLHLFGVARRERARGRGLPGGGTARRRGPSGPKDWRGRRACIERAVGWQLLPGGGAGTDGFYYACLHRISTG